jgi:L-rhamnose-H+ transport protein
MTPNPALGVLFHWLGGLASGSFYVPYRGVKGWAWETYWLVGGVFSWIVAPWVMAGLMTNDVFAVLREASASTHFWAYFFGVLWGLGGLTFGLTMRYLGMSLGMAMVLGYCAAFGTLIPPIFHGEFATKILGTQSGIVILIGIIVCLVGIAIAGLAGVSKEREMPEEEKKIAIKEFNLRRGIAVATFSGVMSACFAFALDAGSEIKKITLQHGTTTLWQGLPVLIVVLLGGFTTNVIWCLILNFRNRTGYQYFNSEIRNYPDRDHEPILENAIDAPSEQTATRARRSAVATVAKPEPYHAPMLSNYLLCALAGTTWYFQFFFYTMGETQMGKYGFSSWTLHMASIIIFSTLWGIALKEWKGSSTKTKSLVFLSLVVLVGSTVIVGYGNYLGTLNPGT